MSTLSPVEVADRYSRKRAAFVVLATLVFLLIHGIGRPFYYAASRHGIDWWAINAAALLAVLATGGGLLNPRRIRELVNDEVARLHHRQAAVIGFWVAMALSLALYLWPGFQERAARDALFLVVTAGVGAALLAFAYFELRAHRDA